LGFPVCRQVIRKFKDIEPKLCNVDGVYLKFPNDITENKNYKIELNGFATMFKGKDYDHNVKQFVSEFISENTPEYVKEYILSTMTNTPEFVGYSSMNNLIDEKYWEEYIINNQTLSIYAKIPELPTDNKAYLNYLFPNMTYYEMKNVNHFLMMEKPKEFNKILEEFIE